MLAVVALSRPRRCDSKDGDVEELAEGGEAWWAAAGTLTEKGSPARVPVQRVLEVEALAGSTLCWVFAGVLLG